MIVTLRFMDFLLDMYTLSEVFLSWVAWVRHTSTSLFLESLTSRKGLSGSGVIGLSSSKLNVTDFVRRVGGSAVGLALLPSDPLESYRVLLPVKSSS